MILHQHANRLFVKARVRLIVTRVSLHFADSTHEFVAFCTLEVEEGYVKGFYFHLLFGFSCLHIEQTVTNVVGEPPGLERLSSKLLLRISNDIFFTVLRELLQVNELKG